MRMLLGIVILAVMACAAAAEVTEGRLVTEPGVEIYWRAAGDGPVVIVPGGFLFGDDLDALAESHRLVLYDMRNRGRSSRVDDPRLLTIEGDVRDLEAIRSHVGAASFSAIGYSYLGKMIVLYALEHPRRIERLVQIGPVPMRSEAAIPPMWDNTGEDVLDPELVARVRRLRAEGMHLENPRAYCEEEWSVTRVRLVGDARHAAALESRCDQPNEWPTRLASHMQHHVASAREAGVTPLDVASLAAPVLTIHGTRDRNAPYGGGREWAAMLPHARLRAVSGAAHQVWLDEPGLVREIASFLTGVWPAAAEDLDIARETWLSQLRGVELLEQARRAHGVPAGPMALRFEGNVYPRSQSQSPQPPYDPFPIELEVLFASDVADVAVDEHFHWPNFVSRYRAVSTPARAFEIDLNSSRAIAASAPRKVWLDQLVRVPPLLVDAALAAPGSVSFLGIERSGAEALALVAATIEATRVTLAIDDTGRVRRVSRIVPDELTGDAIERIELEGEVTIGDVVVPRRVRRLLNGRVASELTVSSGAVPDLTRFEIPEGVSRDATAPRPIAVERIADDVLLVRNIGGSDYNSLVVVHDDGLVLLEAPQSERAMEQVIARLKDELPQSRIKAVMVTHHHFDHSGGIRAAMREGAEIYVPRGSEPLFREIATAPRTLQPGSAALDPSTIRIRGVEGAVIEPKENGPAVHLYDVGENDHADGMLFAWMPARRIVFQGDLFVKFDEPAPARAQTVAFQARIRELGLDVERVIGVHGDIATMEDVDAAIRLAAER